MLSVFEVYFVRGEDISGLLSREVAEETNAQVMTAEEAYGAGLRGLPPPSADRELRYIAVNARDARWIERVLEASELVTNYRVHDLGG